MRREYTHLSEQLNEELDKVYEEINSISEELKLLRSEQNLMFEYFSDLLDLVITDLLDLVINRVFKLPSFETWREDKNK